MRKKTYIALCLVFGSLGIVSLVLAQRGLAEEKNFFDRLDDFGKSIFDTILPVKKSDAEKPKSNPKKENRSDRWQNAVKEQPTDNRRAGSVLDQDARRSSAQQRKEAFEEEYSPSSTMPPVIYRRGEDGTPKPVRRPAADRLPEEEPQTQPPLSRQTPVDQPRRVAAEPAEPTNLYAETPETADSAKPTAAPIHKRLESFGRSIFSAEKKPAQAPQPNVESERSTEPSAAPRPTGRPETARHAQTPSPTRGINPTVPVLEDDETYVRPKQTEPENVISRDQYETQKPRAEKQNDVLFARRGPNLSVETFGPRTISVGRESNYEVHIINAGNVAAEDLVVFISLPEWAEVVGAQSGTDGAVNKMLDGQTGTIQWKVGSLNARGRERLALKIVPRQSRPFDLTVRWSYRPVATQASIEVQEPKLAMQLDGPQEVPYGKNQLFRLSLSNTGTGDAENVQLTLIPVGTGENIQATHQIAKLAAGEHKTLDVELTARQTGNLTIDVEAVADGNLRVKTNKTVLIRRGGLKLAVEGPKVQFVDTVANFVVVASNPGNAPARHIKFALALPQGIEYLSGIEGAKLSPSGDRLLWTVDSIGVGEQSQFTLKCRLTAAGENRVRLAAQADDDLEAKAQTAVKVEAVANLTMDVKDPAGPVPVGEEAVYELRIRNRGTKAASKVEVFAYFSRGIEPIAAEGAPSRLAPGQVVFNAIDSLAPGTEVVLKVRARADAAGNHIFRAETHCKPLSARLVSEATNLYYGDEDTVEQTARQPSEPKPLR